eukprot:5584886-Lingulodinium_polyedra.AAC.1
MSSAYTVSDRSCVKHSSFPSSPMGSASLPQVSFPVCSAAISFSHLSMPGWYALAKSLGASPSPIKAPQPGTATNVSPCTGIQIC